MFPRRAGQHKKSDATKEEVQTANKSGTQYTRTKHFLPIAPVDKEIREIKKDDMPSAIEGGAYRKLRESRAEARYAGKREKRQKEKADEAAAAKK